MQEQAAAVASIMGGQVVGNTLDALADVRWSAETAFFGNYLGPQTARFNDLKLAGEDR